MPLIQDYHDALPYIDGEINAEDREAAEALIAQERAELNGSSTDEIPLHASIPVTYTPAFSALLETAHEAIVATGKPRDESAGIDMTRYEEPSAPDDATDTDAWRRAVREASIAQQYLTTRATNLGLLEKYGKNAWLIANSQIEDDLRALERELVFTKREAESVGMQRRDHQKAVKDEFVALEETWRAGVSRAIEAEIATDALAQQITDTRRRAAAQLT